MCGLLHGSYGWEDPRLLRWRYSAESKSWICSNLQIRGSVSNSSGSSAISGGRATPSLLADRAEAFSCGDTKVDAGGWRPRSSTSLPELRENAAPFADHSGNTQPSRPAHLWLPAVWSLGDRSCRHSTRAPRSLISEQHPIVW